LSLTRSQCLNVVARAVSQKMIKLRELLYIDLRKLQVMPLSTVRVAVIDSGVDASHENLSGKVEQAFKFSSDGSNGKKIIMRRINGGTNNDTANHGTAVAGIITRIAPNVIIQDYRVLNKNCRGKGEVTAGAFEAAVEGNVDIINMSLACRCEFRSRLAAICERAFIAGKIVVASQYFPKNGEIGLPAEFSSCIGVGMGMHQDPFALEYVPKSPIEFLAAGERVPCLRMGGGYESRFGTSIAAAHVSGIVALLLGKCPTLTPFEVKMFLRYYAERRTISG
jgi:subtilisin